MGELARVRELIAPVEGWLSDEEAETLYELARRCSGKGVIVEIGSWKGKSTICLGLGSKAGRSVAVYSIDPYAIHREGFRDNLRRAGIEDVVEPIASTSQEKAGTFYEPIELLFVDGAHEYDLVKADFDLWVPKLVDGGILAMHDTTWTEGPRRVAERYVYRSTRFRNVRFVVGSMTVAQKVPVNSWRDRIRSRYVLALKKSFAGAASLAKRRRGLLPGRLERLGRRFLRRIQ